MQNYKLTIAYDGTNYHGWQMQANARTIQGELTRVLSVLDHRAVTPLAAALGASSIVVVASADSRFRERPKSY